MGSSLTNNFRSNIIDNFDMKYFWLGIVAFVGAITGYFTRESRNAPKHMTEKIKLFILSVATSMFISYITYEISMYFLNANGISVALAGLASFTGTDLAVTMEKSLIDFIERKFKQL